MTIKTVISGTGLTVPGDVITNEEIVASFNAYADRFNTEHKQAIATGEIEAQRESTVAFIEKASGIKTRHVVDKKGVLDPAVMHPVLESRTDDALCFQAEFCLPAAKEAMANANKTAADIDGVIVSCAAVQRNYPAIAIEVQTELGIKGFGFDMMVACSSTTFGIQMARDNVASGSAKSVLVLSPEITTCHTNFRDRDSHFIFGDVCTAVIVERADTCTSEHAFEIVDGKLFTEFSSAVRNNFGFMNRAELNDKRGEEDRLFHQQGRKVFKEVTILASKLINEHLAENNIKPDQLKRLWLHQANSKMNNLIAEKVIGHTPTSEEAPIILGDYGNTASAGSVIAFHQYHQDLVSGDYALLCSFGAGYSIGSLILKKV